MKILVACECSGIVREAFRGRGHDAVSADMQPTELPGPHIVGDVTPLLRERWDMAICFPPCTYLSYAGTAHWNRPGRAESREAAFEFFIRCYNANAPRVAVENPPGFPVTQFRRPDQVINPFDFGESVRKRTCLWLRGLPKMFRADELFASREMPPPSRRRSRFMSACGGSPAGQNRVTKPIALVSRAIAAYGTGRNQFPNRRTGNGNDPERSLRSRTRWQSSGEI